MLQDMKSPDTGPTGTSEGEKRFVCGGGQGDIFSNNGPKTFSASPAIIHDQVFLDSQKMYIMFTFCPVFSPVVNTIIYVHI